MIGEALIAKTLIFSNNNESNMRSVVWIQKQSINQY